MKMTVEQIPQESFSKSNTAKHRNTFSNHEDVYIQVLEDVFSKAFVKGLFDILLPSDNDAAPSKLATPEMRIMAKATLSTGMYLRVFVPTSATATSMGSHFPWLSRM
jgi:hypothetical protein